MRDNDDVNFEKWDEKLGNNNKSNSIDIKIINSNNLTYLVPSMITATALPSAPVLTTLSARTNTKKCK